MKAHANLRGNGGVEVCLPLCPSHVFTQGDQGPRDIVALMGYISPPQTSCAMNFRSLSPTLEIDD
jgi:hypothetical protein